MKYTLVDGAANTTLRQLKVGDTFKAHANAVTLWRVDRFEGGRVYVSCIDRGDITEYWRSTDLPLESLVWKP